MTDPWRDVPELAVHTFSTSFSVIVTPEQRAALRRRVARSISPRSTSRARHGVVGPAAVRRLQAGE